LLFFATKTSVCENDSYYVGLFESFKRLILRLKTRFWHGARPSTRGFFLH
jgi:hypothetical protein